MKRTKKYAALFLAAALVAACVGCGTDDGSSSADAGNVSTESGSEAGDAGSESGSEAGDAGSESGSEAGDAGTESGSEAQDESSAEGSEAGAEGSGEEEPGTVLSHAEYMAAELNTEVVVEAYVQAKQSWWEDKATIYAQDEDGAYFFYETVCSEEDYAKLTPGTKIRVTGFKTEWEGEVEIIDGTFEIIDGNYVAEAEDVTALLGTEELINHQNKFVAFKGLTVVSVDPENESGEEAFWYKADGSGQDGEDLYFRASINGETYTFTVESYLCDNTTDVYAAVKELKVGDKIDMEGFLYWYQGVNPHITSVKTAE